MKTQEFAQTLIAFAGLMEARRADELRTFAGMFSSGKEETIAARLKKMSRATGHPATLKQGLETVRAGLKAAGAKKQATEIGMVLEVFAGRDDSSIEAFIGEITTAPPPKKRPPPPAPTPDHRLARDLADELARTVLDKESFNEVVGRLRNKKDVNTPTLAIIANRFLGRSVSYSDRKAPVADIIKRQKSDAREYARGKALNRVGV
jgi:hypothetical protein